MEDGKKESSITVVDSVRKADTAALITNGVDAFPEDSFAGLYWSGGSVSGTAILEPQYKPGVLHALTTQNNTLGQCVEAMEVNIDGTGFSIDLIEGEVEDEAEKTILSDFFTTPYPGKTMTEIRRSCRRDIEETGNGYIEAIRNAADELVMMNHLSSIDMRLIRLDDPVAATKHIQRGGKEVQVIIRTRERRYVQIINGNKVFFKEYKASRDLNRKTGEWASEGERLPLEDRASEVIHFVANKEPKTPYGSPRWINQLPSVLGSRKAEEHNLEFFDAGGLPPVLIIVQGGTLGPIVKDDLIRHLSGKGGGAHRAAVVEAVSTSGSLDSSGTVAVKVERFGSERQQDAMFQNYDKNCEEHVRLSFRLPPMFIGKTSDFNFATALTSYMVAEAQVFFPERDAFDAKMESVVRELGVTKYKFRSLPVTLVDVANQLKAVEIVSTAKIVDGEDIVSSLNEITGLSLEYTEPPAPVAPAAPASNQLQSIAPTTPAAVGPEIVQLAERWATLVQGGPSSERLAVQKSISTLEPEEYEFFNTLASAHVLKSLRDTGVEALCGCADHLKGN